MIDQLAQSFTVIAPVHPGFGRSELPRGMTTVDDLAYFYLDVIETLDLRDLVVAGISFGGWIAAEIAIKSTERISHLVLADAVGIKLGDREHRDIVDIFTTKQSEVDRLAYHDPSIAAVDHAAISDDDAQIMFRNRETTALFAWSPYMYDPKLPAACTASGCRPWSFGARATASRCRITDARTAGLSTARASS